MAERYTAETVELLTRLLREHGDEIQSADNGLARLGCWHCLVTKEGSDVRRHYS